ncbi:hypothetical protein [Pengzhenrongella sicca]|uniref:Uncharacterized protein n=1 Tax=Pengzhenrongella sicca TaxID=2819238 RepID=A0A8A4ZF30_9MICO|nr:hypothetical protein [Pengzhenrongella sicca]QTE30494.1 hypothetical protein J4E96_05820 [Pengzhenrongella sicca]
MFDLKPGELLLIVSFVAAIVLLILLARRMAIAFRKGRRERSRPSSERGVPRG